MEIEAIIKLTNKDEIENMREIMWQFIDYTNELGKEKFQDEYNLASKILNFLNIK